MAHTKESIAKMLATRAANKAKNKAAKNGNGNGHGSHIPEAIVLLTKVVRTMPSRPGDLSTNDLRIIEARNLLTRKRPEERAKS